MSSPDADVITLQYSFERRLFRRSLWGFWNSAVPRPSAASRIITWVLIWGALLMGTLVLGANGIEPTIVGAGLAGAAILVVGFLILQRTRMSKFAREIDRHGKLAGQTMARFSVAGIRLSDQLSETSLTWAGIDAIVGGRGATVLRSGMAMVTIPNSALPNALTPKAFRSQLNAWREAGQ